MSAKKTAKRGARSRKKSAEAAAEPQSTPVVAEDISTEAPGSTPEVESASSDASTTLIDTEAAPSEADEVHSETEAAPSEADEVHSDTEAPDTKMTEIAEATTEEEPSAAPAEVPQVKPAKAKRGRKTSSVTDVSTVSDISTVADVSTVTEGLAERPSQAELFLVPEVPPSTETLESFGFDEPPPPEDVTENHLKGALEALIFASEKPVRPNELAKAASASVKEVKPVLEELQRDYAKRGIQLVEIAGGYVFRTAALFAPFVRDLTKQKPVKLSRAQIETLAILAYRQPITRPEIDEIRGVDSGPVLKLLLERELIRILGKKDEPGRPILYGTTPNFLEFFNLRSLKDLPTLQEFTELNEDSRRIAEDELGEAFMAVKEQSDEAGLRRDTEFAPPMPDREDYAVSTDLEGEALPNDTDMPGPAEDTIAPPPHAGSMDSLEEDVARELTSEQELAIEGEGDLDDDLDDDLESELKDDTEPPSGKPDADGVAETPAAKDSGDLDDDDDDAFEDDDDDDFDDDSEDDLDDDSEEDLDDDDD